jgi:transcription elongation GreA/GreB family factor
VNKRALVQKIIAQLSDELEVYRKAAQAAHAEATHEQSKAENKYDTRGLEASYLARGQSKQAAEIIDAIEQFRKLPLKSFSKNDPIDLGAIVELESNGQRSFYFLGPRAGGTEIFFAKKEILVITPQSPLGRELVGKKSGERFLMQLGDARNDFEIVSIS